MVERMFGALAPRAVTKAEGAMRAASPTPSISSHQPRSSLSWSSLLATMVASPSACQRATRKKFDSSPMRRSDLTYFG